MAQEKNKTKDILNDTMLIDPYLIKNSIEEAVTVEENYVYNSGFKGSAGIFDGEFNQ